jgi:hypothetical protein
MCIEEYIEAGYSQEDISTLRWLESCSEHLEDLLESYRYLQPQGCLFSSENINKICFLEGIEAQGAAQEMKGERGEIYFSDF